MLFRSELEEYFCCYNKSNDFSISFVNAEFKAAVAAIVIAIRYEKIAEAKKALETAKAICGLEYAGKLKSILAQHKFQKSLNATPESIAFVTGLKL